MSKLKIGVIFGGRSVEHEISLLSAKSIVAHMDPDKYEVFPVLIEKNGTWRRASVGNWLEGKQPAFSESSTLTPSLNPEKPVFYEIENNRILSEHEINVMFPVLHGTYGEDGTVQGVLELMNVPSVGASVLGSSVGMDKIIMKSVLKEAGLPVVDYIGFYSHDWKSNRHLLEDRILSEIGVPCFIKSADLGSSIGIRKVTSENDIEGAVDFSCRFSNRVLVEKAVLKPREIEISVLGNEEPITSVPGEIVSHREFYDYEAKYLEKTTELIAPAELDGLSASVLRNLAVKTYKVLDCSGMGRVDFLIEGETGDMFVSEINTIPGFTEVSMYPKLWEVSGITYSELISKLIDLAIERRKMQDGLKMDITSESRV